METHCHSGRYLVRGRCTPWKRATLIKIVAGQDFGGAQVEWPR